MRHPTSVRVLGLVALTAALACSNPPDRTEDPTPLHVASVTPADGAVDVAQGSAVTITFDAEVDPATLTGAFSLTPAAEGALQVDGKVATFTPAAPLAGKTAYAATVKAGAKSKAGGALAEAFTWHFTTAEIPDVTPPAAPVLAKGEVTATSIELRWTAVGDDGTTGTAKSQSLRYASGAGCPITAENLASATEAAGLGAPQAAGTRESFVVTGLDADATYCFALQVTDDKGQSALSASLDAATADLVAPEAPDLHVTSASADIVGLEWHVAHENGAAGGAITTEELRFAQDAACRTWSEAEFASGVAVVIDPPGAAGTPQHVDVQNLASDHEYCFLLKVADEAGNATFSELVRASTLDIVPPSPIADLRADVLGTKVTLGWTATGDSNERGTAMAAELSYVAGACPAAPPLEEATTVALPAPQAAGASESFAVTGLLPNAAYCFLITAHDDAGLSSTSNLLSVTTGPLDPFAPGAATDLEATALSATQVRLRFSAPADDAGDPASGAVKGYELRLVTGDSCTIDAASWANGSVVSAAAAMVPAAPGTTEELVVEALTQETNHCFGLVAIDETPNRSPIAAFPMVRTPDGTAPAAPELAAGTRTDATIELSWTAVGDDALTGTVTTQTLYRATGECPSTTGAALAGWTAIPTPAPVEAMLPQSQVADGLANGTDYCFFLRVADEAGNTADSATVRASTLDVVPPAKPALSASFVNGNVKLDWTAVGDDGTTGAAAKYLLYTATTTTTCPADLTATAGTPRELARADAAGTPESLLLPHLQAFAKYCFQLRAVDEAGNAGDLSDVAPIETTQTDLVAPAAVTLTVQAATSTGATLAFTAPASDGTDASTGPAAAYDLRYVTATKAEDCAALDAAAFASATSLTTAAPAAPGSAEHVTVALAPKDSGWCLALKSRDGVPNESALSGWVYARDNTAPTAPALAAQGLTPTSATITFTAPGDDGDANGDATGYVLAYRKAGCPSAAADFDFGSATGVTGLAAPHAQGTSESLAVSGLSRAAHYCFALKATDEQGNAAVSLLDVSLPAPDTNGQIAAVRTAVHAATATPITLTNMPVESAIVTYVKAAVGTWAAGTPDGPGFFVQNGATGPALFVAIDPSTVGGLVAGDVVDLSIQTAIWTDCVGTCDPDNSMYAVTAASVTKVDGGATLPDTQDLTNVALTLPIGTGPWAYESERVSATGVVGNFFAGGSGFQKASFTTAGTSSTSLALRVPDTFPGSLGMLGGCTVRVNGTPMWRNGTEAQLAAWSTSDLTVLHCPATIVSTTPADGSWLQKASTISVTFSAAMDPATLTVQSSAGACTGAIQLSADATFTNCVGLSVAVSGATVTLTPVPALPDGQRYRLRVTNPAATLDGAVLPAGTYLSMTQGFATSSDADTCTTPQVIISQVYGGGGNSNAPYKNDFIELHNRGSTPVNLKGMSIQYGSSGGTTWSVTPLGNVTGREVIPPGGYYLVQESSGGSVGSALPTADSTGSINMSATAGKVALVTNTTALSGACPTSATIVDLVGFGGANCAKGAATLSGSNTNSVLRLGNACVDHAMNYADFVPAAAAPHNADGAPNFCGCTGVADAVLNGSGAAGEADLCQLVAPTSLSIAAGQVTDAISGRLTEAGVTPSTGAGIRAELGLGPAGSNPFVGWSYFPATLNAQCTTCNGADEYSRTLVAPLLPGTYAYAWRFSLDRSHWTYCDSDGSGSAGGAFERTKLGTMTVTP